MAYVVETGTGITGANSYVAVADADTYFADRGNTTWAAALSADKQAALIRASSAIDQYGYGLFRGYKSTETQGLEWPRTDAYDIYDYELTGVPVAVKQSTYEGALIELGTAGALTPSLVRGGRVKSERVEGAVTVEYMDSAPSGTSYSAFTRPLSSVMLGGSGASSVLRC